MSLSLFAATFLLTRQTQIDYLNGLAAPFALLVIMTRLRGSSTWLLIAPIGAYVSVSAIASVVAGSEAANALRFYAITVGTLLAFYVRPAKIATPFVLLPFILQALIVTAISVWLGASQDLDLASAVRAYVLDTTWGDIYSYDGIYYHVQVIGNALLPLLFMICFWKYRQGRFYRYATYIALLGVIAAGNLTYTIAIAAAVLIRVWQRSRGRVVVWVLLGLVLSAAAVASWGEIEEIVERKFDGADSSMGVRFDQIDVAVAAWGDSPGKLLVGAGLGAPYPDGRQRNYSEYQYIELQALYLVYQLGAFGMGIYLLTLIGLTTHFLSPTGRTIFWLYVLSGCTNPTVLDTNQIVASMLLVCLFPRTHTVARSRLRAMLSGRFTCADTGLVGPSLGTISP